MKAHKHSGMTLIELMVALAIGMFLMLGAITVFMQSRTTFRITESLARMQENARFALDVLEADIRMAHYWGLTTTTTSVMNRAGPGAAQVFPAAPLNLCGNNWSVNFDQAVQGTNNGYTWTCAGTAPVETDADTLVVRRVTEDPVVPAAGVLHLQSARGATESRLFFGSAPPAGFNPVTMQVHRVIANGYYVSQTSSASVGPALVPSLRVWALQPDGRILNQELMAGVEDMQIQFGIDTDAPGSPDRGSIDRFVNVDDPLVEPFNVANNVEILAVRIWLRVRAERIETGFVDTTAYTYAGQVVPPFNDNFRRLVVSKTIYLRNARPIS